MKRLIPSKRTTLFACCIVGVLLIGGAIVAIHGYTAKSATPHTTTAAHKAADKKSASSVTNNSPTTNITDHNIAGADEQAAADARAQPVTDACKLLTVTVARQLIGDKAASSTTGDTASLQANDTSLSACAYANGGSAVQLVIRKPSNALGVSENATEFGSGRPAGAISVQGYGQSAYWDPAKHTLNVLGSNNWYIISRNSNMQSDCEAVAKLIKTGF